MSSYDFIVDNIRFSYSSVSTFETCQYSYKLTYIDSMPRKENFYAQFGTLVHSCFEKFFTGKLDAFELSAYYMENYDKVVTAPAPESFSDLVTRYKREGLGYFDAFSFDKENYDVLLTEDSINLDINGILFIAKPDLVLRNKITGRIELIDYKTSTPFWIDKKTGKEVVDTKKLAGYKKQLYTYAYALRKEKGISVDGMKLWFPRVGRETVFEYSEKDEKETINWLLDIVNKIKSEEIFAYDNTNPYFCNNLCGVRSFCEYR